MLMNRALAAMANEGKLNADAVCVWLPRPLELLNIAEHECFMQFVYGSMTPAILRANLYTLEIGMMRQLWPMALAMPITATDGVGFCTAPLVRIEAWQLVAKCSGQRGDTAGACNALESAASESLAVGYMFTEMVSLRAMLQWVESDFLGSTDLPGSVEEKSASLRIQARIDIVATKFVSCGVSQYDSSAA